MTSVRTVSVMRFLHEILPAFEGRMQFTPFERAVNRPIHQFFITAIAWIWPVPWNPCSRFSLAYCSDIHALGILPLRSVIDRTPTPQQSRAGAK
jgi:hypothetical protein